jgi:ABC-type uncharacterized transport system YnjBCD substrate-binding protein
VLALVFRHSRAGYPGDGNTPEMKRSQRFKSPRLNPVAVAATAPHASAARLFVNFVLSKDTQTLIRGFGRTVSRTDIAQDEIGKFKVVVEEIDLADRMNEITADYDK